MSSPPDMASPIGKVTSHPNSKPIGIIGIIMNPIMKPITVAMTGFQSSMSKANATMDIKDPI